MNAQEAFDKIVSRLYGEWRRHGWIKMTNEEVESDVDNAVGVVQQLIDQSNAKPKTLEELGWVFVDGGDDWCRYNKIHHEYIIDVIIAKTCVETESTNGNIVIVFTYEEILAIAEKMKELGMTNE